MVHLVYYLTNLLFIYLIYVISSIIFRFFLEKISFIRYNFIMFSIFCFICYLNFSLVKSLRRCNFIIDNIPIKSPVASAVYFFFYFLFLNQFSVYLQHIRWRDQKISRCTDCLRFYLNISKNIFTHIFNKRQKSLTFLLTLDL